MTSITMAKGGEVFVPKMPLVRIRDLAEVMIELLAPPNGKNPYDIEIVELDARPGEKMYADTRVYDACRCAGSNSVKNVMRNNDIVNNNQINVFLLINMYLLYA